MSSKAWAEFDLAFKHMARAFDAFGEAATPAEPQPDFSITTPCHSEAEATRLMQELTELLANKGAKRFRSKYDDTLQSITVSGWAS